MTNMTLTVAALTLAAGTVSAQTMRAEIPFAFRVGKQVMRPGAYQVNVLSSSSTQIVRLENYDIRKSVLAVPMLRSNTRKESQGSLATLRFACYDSGCVLVSMWAGDDAAFDFYRPRTKDGEPRIAEITLRPERAGD